MSHYQLLSGYQQSETTPGGRAIDNPRGSHIVGDMNVKLCVPPESAALKAQAKRLRDLLSGPGVEWDPLAVWFGNRIPQHLWAHWKNELKTAGFTWQTFLKLLHYRTDGAVLWLDGALSWEGFVQQTIALINGPAGEKLARRKGMKACPAITPPSPPRKTPQP